MFLYKLRTLISGILPVLALVISVFDDYSPPIPFFVIGSFLCIIGIALRLWGFNYIGHLIVSSEPQVNELITCGPFGYVRHPIYTATFLILVGLILVLGPTLPIILTLAPLMPYYIFLAFYEERKLVELLPLYAEYKKKVPMLIPSIRRRVPPNQCLSLISKFGITGFIKAIIRYELATPGTLVIIMLGILLA